MHVCMRVLIHALHIFCMFDCSNLGGYWFVLHV